jgi:hypothetical protein
VSEAAETQHRVIRSPGRAELRRRPLKTVTPAQAIGPASPADTASGMRARASTGAITF